MQWVEVGREKLLHFIQNLCVLVKWSLFSETSVILHPMGLEESVVLGSRLSDYRVTVNIMRWWDQQGRDFTKNTAVSNPQPTTQGSKVWGSGKRGLETQVCPPDTYIYGTYLATVDKLCGLQSQ